MPPTPRPQTTGTPQERIVVCPSCGGDSVYSPANAYRPFCSERCKQVDLGAWASEDFRMPAEAPPGDAQYGDPRTEH
ncbi:DNA gyrase inhibitor YacG [Acidovorax sp. NPDC077693]|uniref:DNA gyrase inhibitor YacG n=1 Tax=unclassified Acidovorax TaxID=2684926 RepID=UPI0037C89C9E